MMETADIGDIGIGGKQAPDCRLVGDKRDFVPEKLEVIAFT
jgi:hypothetical protein